MGIRQTDPRAEEGRSHTQFNVADAAPFYWRQESLDHHCVLIEPRTDRPPFLEKSFPNRCATFRRPCFLGAVARTGWSGRAAIVESDI